MISFGHILLYFGYLQKKKQGKHVCTTYSRERELIKKKKRAKNGGTGDKLNLSLVINPGKCSIQNEHQPEKLAAAGKRPKSFCRMRAPRVGEMLLDR